MRRVCSSSAGAGSSACFSQLSTINSRLHEYTRHRYSNSPMFIISSDLRAYTFALPLRFTLPTTPRCTAFVRASREWAVHKTQRTENIANPATPAKYRYPPYSSAAPPLLGLLFRCLRRMQTSVVDNMDGSWL